jgi:hypothetical protein
VHVKENLLVFYDFRYSAREAVRIRFADAVGAGGYAPARLKH